MLVRWAADNRLGYSSGFIKTLQEKGTSFILCYVAVQMAEKKKMQKTMTDFINLHTVLSTK